MDADRYAYYWRALNEGDYSRWDAPNAPFPGFYRFRPSVRDEFQPVAFWDLSSGVFTAGHIGRREGGIGFIKHPLTSEGQRAAIWMGCYCHPITEAQYQHAFRWGEWWDSLRAAPDDAGASATVIDIRKAAAIVPPKHLRRIS